MPHIHFNHVGDGPEKGLSLLSMSGREEISELFHYELLLESDSDVEIQATDIIGQAISLRVDYFEKYPQADSRFIHGVVNCFKILNSGDSRGVHRYAVDLVPSLWFLTKTSDFQVFEDQKSSDIIKKVLSKYSITATMPAGKIKREHCIQYLESDYEFVTRLMADEGFIFYFEHSKEEHKLLVKDAKQYMSGGTLNSNSFVTQWNSTFKFVSGKWDIGDYSYSDGKSLAVNKSSAIKGLDNSKQKKVITAARIVGEGENAMLKQQAEIWTDREDAGYEVIEAGSLFTGICAGASFKIDVDELLPKGSESEFVVINASHQLDSKGLYQNTFTCIPANRAYRGKDQSARPILQGPMTAVVVESGGDKYGRIKVRFLHEGPKCEEMDSCWIRVAQVFSGKGYGAMFTPRIAEEVVVTFINGNPDRPLITGSLYNNKNIPPKDYIGENGDPSRNGFLTLSNELYFEDKTDEELFHVRAGKNYERLVEANDVLTINKGERKILIKEGDENQTLENGNQTITLNKGNHELKLKDGDIILESSAKNIEMKADKNLKIESGVDTKLKSKDVTVKATSSITLSASSKIELKVGGNTMTMDSMGITLKVGGNSVKIEQSGVTVKGVMVKVEGNAQAEVKAPMTTVSGDGMLTVKGGVVMLN